MTGRLVINAAPNEDANRKAAMKKRREKSKRNRERIMRDGERENVTVEWDLGFDENLS
jgi:hypothetical protein